MQVMTIIQKKLLLFALVTLYQVADTANGMKNLYPGYDLCMITNFSHAKID